MPLLECVELVKAFGGAPAVDRVSFEVERGQFFSLLGPSGCGKTTTLRMIAGLEDPDQGDIRLESRSLLPIPAHQRRLGMVFQHYALFPHRSVERNVAYGLERRGIPRAELVERTRRAMEQVQLLPDRFGTRRPASLSGGERQRVALARALVLEPELLLLDEPLGALDLALRKAMQLELRALNRSLGITFLHVTHDQEEALALSDRIAIMDRGRIVQAGSPRELYERPRTEFVARFLGDSNVLNDRTGRLVSIRPERIELDGPEAGSDSGDRGTVVEALYSGERVKVVVALADGTRIMASIANDRSDRFPVPAPGAPVTVRWRPEEAWPLEPDR